MQLIPQLMWSSSTEPRLKHNPPMPMHHGPFPSRSRVSCRYMRYSSLTGAPTVPQRCPSQHASIFNSQVDDAPHIRGYLLFLLSIHLCLRKCRPVRPTTRGGGLRRRRSGERAHRERVLGRGARKLSREQPHRCSIWPRRRQTIGVATGTALRSLRAQA